MAFQELRQLGVRLRREHVSEGRDERLGRASPARRGLGERLLEGGLDRRRDLRAEPVRLESTRGRRSQHGSGQPHRQAQQESGAEEALYGSVAEKTHRRQRGKGGGSYSACGTGVNASRRSSPELAPYPLPPATRRPRTRGSAGGGASGCR